MLSSEIYRLLTHALTNRYPDTPIYRRSECLPTPNSLPLDHIAIFFEYVVVNGKRIFASWTAGQKKSSLVRVLIPGLPPKDAYGEVLEILQIDQDFRKVGHSLWLAQVWWFLP
jgi:hypothetical protein